VQLAAAASQCFCIAALVERRWLSRGTEQSWQRERCKRSLSVIQMFSPDVWTFAAVGTLALLCGFLFPH
jgi:hypothetical protein